MAATASPLSTRHMVFQPASPVIRNTDDKRLVVFHVLGALMMLAIAHQTSKQVCWSFAQWLLGRCCVACDDIDTLLSKLHVAFTDPA